LGDDAEQIPVDEVERIDEREREQNVAAITRCAETLAASRGFARRRRWCNRHYDLPSGD